jgi:ligand-binding sensor domain-containing protein/uncharacterized membrane-anchored protein YhcB (DUF1043 family)
MLLCNQDKMKLLAVKTILPLLLFISLFTAAQTSFYKSYTLPAETTSPKINCLYQNKQGYILVGATMGLYKFDGISFQKFSKDKDVPDDVTSICETKDGKTWIGFGNGKLGWLNNDKLSLQTAEEGSPAKTIKKIIQDSAGVVWIATAGEGIYYYTNGHFYNINIDDGLSDNYVYDITLQPKKGIIAGTDRGLNRCELKKSEKKIISVTSKDGLIDNIVRCLVLDSSNLGGLKELFFWIAMQDAGIGTYSPPQYDGGDSFSWNKPWNYGQINSLIKEGAYLFAASEDYGLIKFQIDNAELAKAITLYSNKTSCLLKDSEGNIWAGGNDQLIRTNGSKLQPLITLPPNEATNLHTLLIDRENHLWMNVSSGLKHLSPDANGRLVERIYKLPVSINSQITALYEDKFEIIWIGTMGNGAFRLDPKTGQFRKITENPIVKNASILSITGKNDDVWIASLEGALQCQLNDQNKNIQQSVLIKDFTNLSGIGTNYIYNIYLDSKNRAWFATDGKGISVYENGKFINYNKKNGLRSEVVYKITEDKQRNIWFSTFNGGIVKFDGKKFKHFSSAEGISDMNITSLASDKAGNIYVAHKNGIDLINSITGNISYLDGSQGIIDLNTDLNTLSTDDEGNVYFIASNSIYKYASTVLAQPKVVIDRVQLFLNNVDVENNHTFSPSEDNISFYYTGLYYSQPEKLQYQYKLEGFGEEWITTNDRRRDFPKLPPGTYTFRVKASLNKNFSNASEASFTFTIQNPLWMRWWFITLCALVTGGILYWYIKDREKRLQKWERLEKEKIQSQFETLKNQVNPHFLFNSFNTLVSEIEDDPKRAVQYVEHMADFFRSIVTYREKDTISLEEELNIIKDYLFIQRKRYGNAFRVDINIPKEDQLQYHLAPLTLQLLAENAIKHNSILKEKPLLLEVFIEADQLIIRNNVNTKLHPEKSAGLGLQNIYKRYQLLAKKSVIVSKDDAYFTVIIPLIKKTNGKDTDNRR